MFYTYMLKDPITQLPFYVGVGKVGRKSSTTREKSHINEAIGYKNGKNSRGANRYKLNVILQILSRGLEVDIEIVTNFNTEVEAFDDEIRLIKYYGRRDLGTGILTNLTNGGEGAVNQSAETKRKRSETMKGRPSPLNGRKLGPYSEERKQAQKEKMMITKQNLTDDEKEKHHQNRSSARAGKAPWNKGLTKETSESVNKYSQSKIGKPRIDMIGHVPWNKGKECPNISMSRKGQPAHNKGKPSKTKGMTYEEMYGPEKAAELREKRRQSNLKRWRDSKSN